MKSKFSSTENLMSNQRVNRNREMKSHKEIYNEIRKLVSKVEHLSPRLSNLGLGYSFHAKLGCLEIMQRHTLEKIKDCGERERGFNLPTRYNKISL